MENYNLSANQAQEVLAGAQIGKIWQDGKDTTEDRTITLPVTKARATEELKNISGRSQLSNALSAIENTPAKVLPPSLDTILSTSSAEVVRQDSILKAKTAKYDEIQKALSSNQDLSAKDRQEQQKLLDRQREEADSTYKDLIMASKGHVAVIGGAISKIKTPEDLRAARQLFTDQAIKQLESSGVTGDEAKQQAATRVDELLPKEEGTKELTPMQLGKLKGTSELIYGKAKEFSDEEMYLKKRKLEIDEENAQSRRKAAGAAQDRAEAAKDKNLLVATRDGTKDLITAADKERLTIQAQLNELNNTPPPKSTRHWTLTGQVEDPNAAKDSWNSKRDELNSRLTKNQERLAELRRGEKVADAASGNKGKTAIPQELQKSFDVVRKNPNNSKYTDDQLLAALQKKGK